MVQRNRKGQKRVAQDDILDEQTEPSEHPEQLEHTDERETILQVEQLEKAYTIPGGQLQVLLGALDTPDSGEIWLHNQAVHKLRGVAAADFRREQVGFVFQLFYLLPNLTALENVMAPLLPYRRKLNFDLKQRAKELLEQVGLAKRMGHAPARLSGGEQQRVAIARALINRPNVLLADEPTGTLDPHTAVEVLDVLRGLQRAGSQTLIMVTHDPQVAALADRCIHLEHLSKVGE